MNKDNKEKIKNQIKKFISEDVEEFCRKNGYYIDKYWFPHRQYVDNQ